MGNKNETPINKSKPTIPPSKSSFIFEAVIGRGGFGRVWRVTYKPTKQKMALKQISKAMILENKTFQSYLNERNLLVNMNNNPFIVKIHFAFQDKYYLYIAMDLLTGGDLRFHLMNKTKFTEEQTKFFVCSVLLGLESLSRNNTIHRDIKPENLVFDDKGYLKLTDFGVANTISKVSDKEISGTLGYMSPEVMLARQYTLMTDYFALGVVAYEIMLGRRPYDGATRNEIRRKIISSQILITKKDIPIGWSIESADFINRLLQRTPGNRLGFRGISDIKNHSWLKFFNWNDLYNQTLPAPFIPSATELNYDVKYCKKELHLSRDAKKNLEKWLRDPQYIDYFAEYNYTPYQDSSVSVIDKTAVNSQSNAEAETETKTELTNNRNKTSIYGQLNPYVSIKNYLKTNKEEKVVNVNVNIPPPDNLDDLRIILKSSNKNIIVFNEPSAEEDVNYNKVLLLSTKPIVNDSNNVNDKANVQLYHSPSTNTSTPQINNDLIKIRSWKGSMMIDKQRRASNFLSKYYENNK